MLPQPPTSMSLAKPPRPWHRSLGSLRVQLSVGSALVALGAIALVTALALVGANLTIIFSQRTMLSTEAARVAQALGQGSTDFTTSSPLLGGGGASAGPTTDTPHTQTIAGPYLVWIMDPQGRLIVQTVIAGAARNAQDATALRAALQAALSGEGREDILPSSPSWISAFFVSQPIRWYVALPIHAGGVATGPITGAVALSMPAFSGPLVTSGIPESPGSSLLTTPGLGTWMTIGAAVLIALLAVVVAIVFARRLTRPLEQLVVATHALRAGKYATRVHQRAPREIQDVMDTFNLMAATLETHIRELQHQEHQRRELLAAVAHDLATPLTMIQGYTEALADGTAQSATRRAAATQVIGREVERLRRLVDQVRQMALVEAGITAVQLQAIALGAIVEDTLAALAPALVAKPVTMQTAGLQDLPPVAAHRDWMTQILVNLVENAIRYTPAGGQITMRAEYGEQEVCLRIEDTGPGIARADRERVFERFTRLDAARNSATGGSGLGLAIVKALVEAQGGTIVVEDAEGGGACFALRFPCVRDAVTDDSPTGTP